MKKYMRNHIGERWETNEGYVTEIIDGGSKPGYCVIKIENWVSEITYNSLKRGNVKYPYHKSVFNIGFTGEGNYTAWKDAKNTKAYTTWRSMLLRCYAKEFLIKQPTYKGCSVAKDWHNFQNFGAWFEEHYQEGYALDKDLLVPGNKVYSPETCIFLPQKLNNFLATQYRSNTSGYTGVCWNKNNNKWQAVIHSDGKNKYLGLFNSLEDAAETYNKARKIEAEKLKEEYKDVLPQYVLEKIR